MKKYIISSGSSNFLLKKVEEDIPRPAESEVLVRWKASSLNYHDLLVVKGLIPVEEGRVPMSDGVGEVVEVGKEVVDWKQGDKVMSLFFPDWTSGPPAKEKLQNISGESVDGFLTEYSCVLSHQLTRVPREMSWAEAATLPCAALTAYNALMYPTPVLKGEKVLIQGTGGMSMMAFQIAKALGAKIFVTTSSEDKANRLTDLGAEGVFNYKTADRWGKTIYKETGGVDRVLDVGGGTTMIHSIEAAKIGGSIISIGILGNGRKGEITFPKLFFKFLNIHGIAVGSKIMQNDMISFYEENNISPLISNFFKFDDVQQAFIFLSNHRHFGKVVVLFP